VQGIYRLFDKLTFLADLSKLSSSKVLNNLGDCVARDELLLLNER